MMLDDGIDAGNKIRDPQARGGRPSHSNPRRRERQQGSGRHHSVRGRRAPADVGKRKARGTPATKVSYTFTGSARHLLPTECAVERKGADKYTDTAPGSGNYVMTLFNRDGNNGNSGKCGLPAADEIVALTKDKALLKKRIEGLGFPALRPDRSGRRGPGTRYLPTGTLWDASSAAAAYDSDTQKIAILMTDGEYTCSMDTNGVSTGALGAGSAANTDSSTQARAVCTEMKKKVMIYTVGFALGGNKTAIDTLNHCASAASMAYKADNGNELQQAFRDIALKINQLYLTQ